MKEELQEPCLAARATGLDCLIGPAILLVTGLLLVSWWLPFMTVMQFVWLSEEVSLLTGLVELLESGNFFLFAILLLFCVAFPLLKLGLALFLWFVAEGGQAQRVLRWMETLGKWSMLDVFVVALSVVALNLSLVTDVEMHAGIYLFTAAVLLSMLLVQRITKLAHEDS